MLGKPERFARYYYEQGADELLYMDVVASLYGRNSLLEFITKTSRQVFIPLTVGGGLRTLDDIRTVLPMKYFHEIMEYIGMEPGHFLGLCDTFRSRHLWRREKGEWKVRHQVV